MILSFVLVVATFDNCIMTVPTISNKWHHFPAPIVSDPDRVPFPLKLTHIRPKHKVNPGSTLGVKWVLVDRAAERTTTHLHITVTMQYFNTMWAPQFWSSHHYLKSQVHVIFVFTVQY